MAKKWKNKLKKQQKAQVIREMLEQDQATHPQEKAASPMVTQTQEVVTSAKKFAKNKFIPTQTTDGKDFLPEVARVKQDMRKIGYIVGSILVILVAVVITDQKYNWVLDVTHSVLKSLNF